MTVEARRSRVLLGLALSLVIAAGLVWAARRSTGATVPLVLTDVHFRDQTGAAPRPGQLRNQALLVHFVFTRCGSVCPQQTRQLARVRGGLASDIADGVTFLSISIDPARDTPRELQRFAEENGAAQANWSLLVAEPAATRDLLDKLAPPLAGDQRRAGAETAADGADTRLARHDTDLYLFDGAGRLVQRYAGSALDSKRLSADLTRLVRIARARRLFSFEV